MYDFAYNDGLKRFFFENVKIVITNCSSYEIKIFFSAFRTNIFDLKEIYVRLSHNGIDHYKNAVFSNSNVMYQISLIDISY